MACAIFRFANRRNWLRRDAMRLVAAVLVLLSAEALAQRSYFRLYDQDYGLDVGEIVALVQDGDGFLWIGSHRGLVRFDGRTFVPWGQDEVDEVVSQLIYGPDDELLIRTATGRGLRRTAQLDSGGHRAIDRTSDRTVPTGTAGVLLFLPGGGSGSRRTTLAGYTRGTFVRPEEFFAAATVISG